jgi:hypothetical protein
MSVALTENSINVNSKIVPGLKNQVKETHVGVEVNLRVFLTSTLDGREAPVALSSTKGLHLLQNDG